MLVGRRLQTQAGFAPGAGERVVVVELADVVADVGQQQAQTRDIARPRVGLQPLNSMGKLLASHGIWLLPDSADKNKLGGTKNDARPRAMKRNAKCCNCLLLKSSFELQTGREIRVQDSRIRRKNRFTYKDKRISGRKIAGIMT